MNYVLGGKGFIGRNVIKEFDAVPLEHDLLDDPSGKFEMLQPGDIVFHAAHAGSVDDCAKDPVGTRKVNVEGSIRFLSEIKKYEVVPVYFSTNMVFSGQKAHYSELDTPHAKTEYGKQKREVEKFIMDAFPHYIILRMTKVYGPGSGSFLDSWIEALRHKQEIRAAKDMFAAPVFIDDVMRNLRDFLASKSTGIHHMSCFQERSMVEIAKIVMSHMHASEKLLKVISIADLNLFEKRSLHNSLACDTVRDIPEVLHDIYN